MDPSTYTPAQPYSTKHSLEPPNRAIPPPDLQYHRGEASFAVEGLAPFEYGSSDYGNPAFLKSIVACGDLHLSHSMLSWKYRMRRRAQFILPFLLLGPSSAARDATFIRDAGITLLLAVRSASAVRARPDFLDLSAFASVIGIKHLTVDLDSPYEMRVNLRPTIKALNDHLEQSCTTKALSNLGDIKGRILVFCESGNERSATLVAAYLMTVFGIDMVTAIQIIQSQRFCISPDNAMKDMLSDLGTYLQAERQVAVERSSTADLFNQPSMRNGYNSNGITLNKSSKRGIDRAYELDDEMNDENWAADNDSENGERGGVAPFADVVK